MSKANILSTPNLGASVYENKTKKMADPHTVTFDDST